MKYRTGMLLKCNNDFILDQGGIAFTEGKEYRIDETSDTWSTMVDDDNIDHSLDATDVVNHFDVVQD